jgi:RNA polymerase sigma-70 factor (ECF subfamily)
VKLYEQLSDHELVKLTLNDDQSSYAELVKRYQSLVKHVCIKVVRSDSIADEISQSTFLSAWEKLFSFKFGSFKSWLVSIAYRQAVSFVRRHKNETTLIAAQTSELALRENMGTHQTDNAADFQLILDKAMSDLTEVQQHVITLVYIAGMSYAEVAESMQIPISTAKSHSQRAMKKILHKVNGEIDE